MNYFRISVLALLFYAGLFSCTSGGNKDSRIKCSLPGTLPRKIASQISGHFVQLSYVPTDSSEAFHQISRGFSIDSTGGVLTFDFAWTVPPGFTYPITKKTKRELRCVNFCLEIKEGGKSIKADGGSYTCGEAEERSDMPMLGSSILMKPWYTCLGFDGKNVVNHIQFRIPCVCFHNLKRGNNALTFHLYQTKFSGDFIDKHIPNKTDTYTTETILSSLISYSGNFNLFMPPIYRSVINCTRVVLKDNVDWDFVFDSGWAEPDLYWRIETPCFFIFKKSNTYIDHYKLKKTTSIPFYFFTPQDSIAIGIYDEDSGPGDNFDDDIAGKLRTTVEKIPEDKELKYSFELVSEFIIRRDPAVPAN